METGHLAEKEGTAPGEESLGYIIQEKNGGTFVYLLDASGTLPESTLELLTKEKINCLVADCTYFDSKDRTGHMDIKAVSRLKTLLNPNMTVASHISHMNLGYSKLKSALAEHGIVTGYDGMVLEI